MGEKKLPPRRTRPAQAEIEAQRKKDLAQAEARGRTSGLREALLLVGLGLGLGVVKALTPSRPRPHAPDCGLEVHHQGDCQPDEELLTP